MERHVAEARNHCCENMKVKSFLFIGGPKDGQHISIDADADRWVLENLFEMLLAAYHPQSEKHHSSRQHFESEKKDYHK